MKNQALFININNLRSYTIGLLEFFSLLPNARFHLAQFLLPCFTALPALVEALGELGLKLDHSHPQNLVLTEGDAQRVLELPGRLLGRVAAGRLGLT
jgi:hypothetical protein